MHVVEGLEGGRVAVVEKTHLALVDGGDTVDLAQVLLDADPEGSLAGAAVAEWHPALEPGPTDLVVGALWESAQDPVRAVDNLRGLVAGALGVALAVGEVVGGTLGAGSATWPATRCAAAARPPAHRWPAPSRSRAGSPPCGSRSPTCRPSTPRTATPSTTSSSPWSRAGCAPGCSPAAGSAGHARCARWCR